MQLSWKDNDEMPDEVDFAKTKRVPNTFVQNFRELNLISLDPDVQAVFPRSESVNIALRQLLQVDGIAQEGNLPQDPARTELPKAS